MALGKVYCFGPTFRAEKSQDAPPPHRVLDGRARGRLHGPRRRHGPRRGLRLVHRRHGVLETREKELARSSSATSTQARERRSRPSRASPTTRRSSVLQGRRPPERSAATTSAATRRPSLASQFDRPVMVHRYPAALKAFYFKRDPDDPRVALGCDVLAPEGYGEIIGGGQREDDLATLEAAHRRAQAAARGLRVVPRPAPLRLRAARRLRPRRRAHASPGSAASTTCARPSRSRA